MKMPLFLITMIVLLMGTTGCSTGMISVDAIDGSIEKVSVRHDAYVKADTTLSAAQKATYLRTTELLRKVLAEAKAPTVVANTNGHTNDVAGYYRRSAIRQAQTDIGGPLGTTTVRTAVVVPVR